MGNFNTETLLELRISPLAGNTKLPLLLNVSCLAPAANTTDDPDSVSLAGLAKSVVKLCRVTPAAGTSLTPTANTEPVPDPATVNGFLAPVPDSIMAVPANVGLAEVPISWPILMALLTILTPVPAVSCVLGCSVTILDTPLTVFLKNNLPSYVLRANSPSARSAVAGIVPV